VDLHANSHLMPNDKSSQLDFKTDYPEYGVRQPLLSSGEVNWNGFSLEHHLQPKLEISEHYHTEHMISIHLDRQPNQLEIGMDETYQDVRWQPGDIFIVPAYVNHTLAWGHNAVFDLLCPTRFSRIDYFRSDSSFSPRARLSPHARDLFSRAGDRMEKSHRCGS
jgi:hypothetical protein